MRTLWGSRTTGLGETYLPKSLTILPRAPAHNLATLNLKATMNVLQLSTILKYINHLYIKSTENILAVMTNFIGIPYLVVFFLT